MPKTIRVPKISLIRIPIEMSSGQSEQVVEKMEEEEAGKEKKPQSEVETPTKRTTVKGSGAGPLSAKKKAQKPKSKPSKPVKVAVPKPQRMIEVVGTDGRLYTVSCLQLSSTNPRRTQRLRRRKSHPKRSKEVRRSSQQLSFRVECRQNEQPSSRRRRERC